MYDSAAGVRKEAFWPTESQELLLKTALLRGPAGLEAWQAWRSKYDFLDHPHGHGAFRLFPMVYRRLVADGIDEPLLPRLKGIYRYWWSANHRLFAVSAPLLDRLHQAGIRTMVLKGAAIGPLYYRDMGARPMSDVDVLVPLDQVGPALDLLGRLGWRAVTPSVPDDIRFRHSVEMRDSAGQEFDLHWHAFRECLRTDSDDDLWRSAVPTRIGDVPTLAPDATFALLHTVVHGIRWNPEPSIRWIPDSMAILGAAGADLDWERLLDQADRRRLRLQLGTGLRYLRETVGAPVPESALERLRAARTSRIERLEYRCLSLGAEERERMFFGYVPFFLVEYLRWADGKNPIMKAVGIPWYMYYRVRSQPDLVPPAIRLWVRRARAAFLPGSRPAPAAETRSAVAEADATPPEKAPYRDAWRYFESCSRGGLRRVLGYGAVAAAQSLLVLPVLLLIRHALDQSIPQGRISELVIVGAAIFGLRLVAGAAALWLRVVHIRLIKDAVSRLREDLLTRLYTLSRFHYTQRDRQTMQARIVQDTERLDNMSNQVASKFLPAVFSAAALLAVLGYLNWILLLSLLALAPILFLTARMTGRMVKGRVFVFQRAFERFSKGISFVLQHMDLTRVQSYEMEETQRRVADLEHLRDTGQEMAYSFALHGTVQTIVVTLSGIVILVVGGTLVAAKSMTLGQFFSFWVAAGLLNGFIGMIANAIPDIIVGNESMVTLYRLAHTGERVPYHGRRRIPFAGRVRLESVEFGYGDSPILRGVDLEIAPGSNIAIVGPNGAGKSTILYLILGFYRPVKGRLLADEVPYEEIDLPDLRRGIGVVMQHPTFFAGTIREIITYGSLDATPDDMQRAARAALAEDFIQKLPAGYDTQIGEDALLLSGGEAQRLAIARALLRRPKVLVLDEPTNHLEIGAVDRLMVNLAEMENRPAIVTISHDRQVLRHATSVFGLEDGRLRPQPAAGGLGAGAEVHG